MPNDFTIEYKLRTTIKGQALVNFIVKNIVQVQNQQSLVS